MNRLHAVVLFTVALACSVLPAQTLAPRASAKDYPASKSEAQYAIGAKMLSKTQVQNSFATLLAGRYLVVEVGFYPQDGRTIDLEKSAFTLKSADGKDSVEPASPEQIASILQKRPSSGRDVTLYPQANVGYESYPVYDGTRVKQVGGPVYGAGLGVAVGESTSAATTDSDRRTMETELRDKELKSGDVSKPVAGYLYFPLATKEKVKYELQYSGPDAVSTLALNGK
ncbi:MAG TPA: hypothetical protein VF772_03830 [Terriglobales bacterium]